MKRYNGLMVFIYKDEDIHVRYDEKATDDALSNLKEELDKYSKGMYITYALSPESHECYRKWSKARDNIIDLMGKEDDSTIRKFYTYAIIQMNTRISHNWPHISINIDGGPGYEWLLSQVKDLPEEEFTFHEFY